MRIPSIVTIVLAVVATIAAETPAFAQFTDDPLTAGTPVKTVHITDLRTAIANLRVLLGLGVFTWTDDPLTPGGTIVKAIHIAEMRAALDQVYDALPKPRPVYTDPILTGLLINAVHIEQLRTAVLNVTNDAPSFTKGADQTVNEDATAQTIVGWATAISPGPRETTQTVTFVFDTNDNPALFSAGPSVASNGTLTYTPAANQNGVAHLTLHAHDDGGTSNGGVDNSPTQSFMITVNPVNDAPGFTKGADETVAEDTGLHTVVGWATAISPGPGEAGQALTFNITGNTNAALFSVAPAVAADGTLTYTLAANVFGSSTITLTLSDNGGTASGGVDTSGPQTFSINVIGVNDAPSFTKGANQTVTEDAGPQSVIGWATSLSPGPANEAGQTVSFVIDANDNTGLFSAGPAVAANGTLTYTPAANQNGVASITLHIHDNGGTANGGVDNSATQSFTITVNATNDAPVVSNKTYGPNAVQANMKMVGLTGLLSGVVDVDAGVNGCSPSFTVTNVSATTPAGGTVTVTNATTGTFDFEPPAGVTGNVTFTYTVQDTGCPGTATSAAATVTVNVAGPVIWFVDSTAPGGGNSNGTWTGTNARAFQTVGQAAAVDASDHRVFVLNNNASSLNYTGIPLNTGEWLVGQGVTGASFDAVVLGLTPPAGTVTRPAINGVRPTLLSTTTLASGVTVTGVNFTPNSAVAAMTASALAATAAITIDQVIVSGTGGATSALSLTNVTATGAGALNISNASFTNTSGAELLVLGGNIPISLAATISSNAGRSVDIQNRTGGTVTLSGSITDTATGIFLNANTGSTINFTGGVTVSTGANPGFTATGGGTIAVCDENPCNPNATGGLVNTLTTTTGTALNVANTTIGSNHLEFRSISAGTAAGSAGIGIILNTTGSSGGLRVSGTGTAGSGGTIQHKTGANGDASNGIGISLNNTSDVRLAWMQLNHFDNHGIRANAVNGFRLTNTNITGTSGTEASGATLESAINFSNVTGTVTFQNNEITGGFLANVYYDNSSGTTNLNFLNNNVHHSNAAFTGDGFLLEADTTAVFFANVSNNTFTANGGDHFNMSLVNSANVDLTFNGNDLNGGQPGALGQGLFILGASYNGTFKYDISGNDVQGNVQGGAIVVNKGSGTGTFSGRIANNIVGNAAVTGSGSAQAVGIHASARGAGGSHTTLINNNQVFQYFDRGIVLEAGEGSPTFVATVTANTVSNFADAINSLHGIHFDLGILGTDNAQITIDVRNNLIANAGNEPQGGVDFRMRTAGLNDTFIAGYSGGNSSANAQAFIDSVNPAGTTFSVTQAASGTYNNGPASPLPSPNLPTLPPAP